MACDVWCSALLVRTYEICGCAHDCRVRHRKGAHVDENDDVSCVCRVTVASPHILLFTPTPHVIANVVHRRVYSTTRGGCGAQPQTASQTAPPATRINPKTRTLTLNFSFVSINDYINSG